MTVDHECDVSAILEAFDSTWTFDVHDLHKPSVEQVLRDLIEKREPSRQQRLKDEFFGTGALASVLERADVQEIIVNGPREIWIECNGTFERVGDYFLSDVTYGNFIDRLCSQAGLRIDLSQPFADGSWHGYRVHLARAPLSHCSYHLSLRRRPEQPWTLERLMELGWCTPAAGKAIRGLISERRNVLVIGPTGSGKTSVLGACLRELPDNERTVIIEDTDELIRPNAASTKLLTRPATQGGLPEITLQDLVRQSLRMRPSRLVVGEVRGAEAKDLLLALATGHSGSWGTLHASEARQALLRLEMLVQLGAPQWNVQAVRQLLQLSLDALVVCGFEGNQRRLLGLFKVAAIESFGLLLDPMDGGPS